MGWSACCGTPSICDRFSAYVASLGTRLGDDSAREIGRTAPQLISAVLVEMRSRDAFMCRPEPRRAHDPADSRKSLPKNFPGSGFKAIAGVSLLLSHSNVRWKGGLRRGSGNEPE